MKRITLSVACGDYDILRPLCDGRVVPDGIDLVMLNTDRGRMFDTRRRGESDIAEVTITQHLRLSQEGYPYTGLPVFPHRRFRYGFVFVSASSALTSPGDLAGRRVGLAAPASSTTVWLRGMLQHEHGLDLGSVDWVVPAGTPAPDVLPGSRPHPREAALDEALLAGEIDALVSSTFPSGYFGATPAVRRLLADSHERDLAFYRRTGIFPIQHLFTLPAGLADRYPWVPTSLSAAFEEAKRIALRRAEDPRTMPVVLSQKAWEEQVATFGADPWPYGMTPANRHNLQTVAGYALEQGLLRHVDLDGCITDVPLELFRERPREF